MAEWMNEKTVNTDQGLEGNYYARQGGTPPWEIQEPKRQRAGVLMGVLCPPHPQFSLWDQNPRAWWRPARESAQPKAICALFLSGAPRMPCTSRVEHCRAEGRGPEILPLVAAFLCYLLVPGLWLESRKYRVVPSLRDEGWWDKPGLAGGEQLDNQNK